MRAGAPAPYVNAGGATLARATLRSRLGDIVVHRGGTGPALVLLHGGAGSWTHWIRNIPALVAHYTVHALDLPGCGDSADAPNSLGAEDYFELMAEAIGDGFGSREALRLAGFSFGGVTAVGVAARLGRRVVRLSLAGPGGLGLKPVPDFALRKVPFESKDRRAIDEALRHNLLVIMLAKPESIDEETLELHRRNILRVRFDSRKVGLGDSLRGSLPRVGCDVQVIWGEKDAVAFPSVSERAQLCRALSPRVRIDVIPGAGHWVQYEAPEAFDRTLLDFLR
jgi:pimeloyl-ACP methyl ester carboxylesterase